MEAEISCIAQKGRTRSAHKTASELISKLKGLEMEEIGEI